MTINNVVVFVDKVQGEVVSGKSAKTGNDYTYLKGGLATLQVRGKPETVRINWFGVTPELLGRGATLHAEIEMSEYEGKTYTQLSVRKAVPAYSNKNEAILTGKVVSFKEFNKVLSVELEVAGTGKGGVPLKAIQKVTVLDKASAVAEIIKNNKGNEMLFTGSLTPSKGFTDYTITGASVVGANSTSALDAFSGATTGAEVSATPADDLPF